MARPSSRAVPGPPRRGVIARLPSRLDACLSSRQSIQERIMLAKIALTFAALALAVPSFTEAQAEKPKGSYADINGMKMYYEIHGRGEPLIMLHGGVMGSEAFGSNIEALANTRQVIAVHLQGHGNTRDIDRPFRFEYLADDVAALVAKLKLKQVDVLGWSFGGGTALQMAIRHPALVRKLVVVGQTMTREGWFPEVNAEFPRMAKDPKKYAATVGQAPMPKGYPPLPKLYPHVNWTTLFQKMGELESLDFDWSKEVAALKMPVMLVFADADAISTRHIAEFYNALGGGVRDAGLDGTKRPKSRLAILPGTTHYNIMQTTAVAEIVEPFLAAK
jgi:pimeloyl-ACP methyl ester carboxylesterase